MQRAVNLFSILVAVIALSTAAACTSGDIPAPPDVAAPPADSLKTPSGLSMKWLQRGSGQRHPRATDRVTVHYTGWTTDGKMFDSSITKAQAATFNLNGVIDGWTEGVQRMVEGDKARMWIPEEPRLSRPGRKPQGTAGLRYRADQNRIVEDDDGGDGGNGTSFNSETRGNES